MNDDVSGDITAPLKDRARIWVALLALRRQYMKTGQRENAAAIRRLMRSRTAFNLFSIELRADPVYGDWIDSVEELVKFFLEYADEIIALVMMIIELFSGGLEQAAYFSGASSSESEGRCFVERGDSSVVAVQLAKESDF